MCLNFFFNKSSNSINYINYSKNNLNIRQLQYEYDLNKTTMANFLYYIRLYYNNNNLNIGIVSASLIAILMKKEDENLTMNEFIQKNKQKSIVLLKPITWAII